jgi:hypothetical protein
MNLPFRALLFGLVGATLLSINGCGAGVCDRCGVGGGDASSSAASSTAMSSTASGAGCPTTAGTLSGTVTLVALTGDPSSSPAPKALIDLRKNPSDPSLQAMADDAGHYSVDLAEGTWIVGGTSADGFCTTMMPKTVIVEACKPTTADVVLESCAL